MALAMKVSLVAGGRVRSEVVRDAEVEALHTPIHTRLRAVHCHPRALAVVELGKLACKWFGQILAAILYPQLAIRRI